jgi:two-component system phosphate regulon sensor histidine kinase PhoR
MADPVSAAQRLELLAGFADALGDPCVILDRRGVVLHRNPPAAEEFPAIAEGGVLTLALRNPALLGAIDTVRREGAAQSVELHQTVPNETWHRASVAPLPGGEGLLSLTLHNLTDQKRLEQLRSDFIANASHELRTPLTSLVGFIDTLLGPAATDEAARERFLGIMRQQAARMSALIDDLLSLSRIELRQHLRPTGSVDLAKLLADVRDGLETQAAEAGVAIGIEAPHANVTGDANELQEVFENLLDNAIKYGGEGGRVEMAVSPGRAGYDYAITITDHGAGIAAEHVPRLTERFYRVDAESSRKKKGTGLGLAIVKHIVNRHRGLLTIRSKPGEGTRVEVLLNK